MKKGGFGVAGVAAATAALLGPSFSLSVSFSFFLSHSFPLSMSGSRTNSTIHPNKPSFFSYYSLPPLSHFLSLSHLNDFFFRLQLLGHTRRPAAPAMHPIMIIYNS